jgi:hypothetical protein
MFHDISGFKSTSPTITGPFPPHSYVELVRNLRNPSTAGPIDKWMATGQQVSQLGGAKATRERLPKLRRQSLKVTAGAYASFFDENMSGYAYARLTQASAKKVRNVEKQVIFEEPMEVDNVFFSKKSWLHHEEKSFDAEKPLPVVAPVKSCSFPAEIYTKDRSEEQSLKLFTSLENVHDPYDQAKNQLQQ